MLTYLFDIPTHQAKRYAKAKAFANYEQGKWTFLSSATFQETIQKTSIFLLEKGLKPQDCIAIISKSGNAYWNIIDFAAQQIGVVVVPILSGLNAYQMDYILSECNIKMVFFSMQEDEANYAIILQDRFETYEIAPNLFQSMKEVQADDIIRIENRKKEIQATDLATIIYTSGTTGEPKGVMLSHQNIVSNILALMPLIPEINDKRVLSFLPLSHIFERTVTYTYMAMGASIYYTNGVANVETCLLSAQPQYMTAVPRLVEKMLDKVLEYREKSNPVLKIIIDWALAEGKDFEGEHKESVPDFLKRLLADWVVFRRWRKALGGQVEGIIVGAAALQPRLSRLFSAAGIPIREGYGCTETSPVVSFNRFNPGGFMYGTVGIPLPGVEVKIESAEQIKGEGEIWVKGPNVMMGYYNKPIETREVITADGWYKTGDIGHFTNKWFLKITDRQRDIFKTSNGRYIAPQIIENQLKTTAFIDQCLVYGLAKPYVVALIVPNFHFLKEWCEQKGIHWTAPQYMVLNPKVQKHFQKIINVANEQLNGNEHIVKFHLLFEEWSIDKGELTPTLKLRRRIIVEKHLKEIEEMYIEKS
jgi:long-chain acyl-CoA synthetase